MVFPSEKEFLHLSRKGNLIPVYQEINGDLETPVSAYFKIAQAAKYSFLLESVEGEEKVARYSFLARDPEIVIRSKNGKVEIFRRNSRGLSLDSSEKTDNPLVTLRKLMSRYKFVSIPGLPRFCGGMVGYMSYDVVRYFEKIPHTTLDDLKLPDVLLAVAKNIIIFDHRNHKIKVVSCVKTETKDSPAQKKARYRKALQTINGLISELKAPLRVPGGNAKAAKTALKVSSNFTESQFQNIIKKAKKKIQVGDIIQVVLSQRFMTAIKTSPFNIYRALRTLNPSPYMYYLNFDSIQIIGSSPELLVRCEDGIVDTRPIAGTRPRGKTDDEDTAYAKDLLNDPKEKAEHIMLVDLGRNDLGRVCQKGKVSLSEFMIIEKYSHVMHIVSNVRGKLRPDKDIFDVLQACFPAGTVSGAPKIRAMEIIDELENVNRGPYAGCIGYFSFSKNLDTCITIRTIITTGGKAYVQAGAGIVADSQPHKEYRETVNKAKAQIMALETAHQQPS